MQSFSTPRPIKGTVPIGGTVPLIGLMPTWSRSVIIGVSKLVGEGDGL